MMGRALWWRSAAAIVGFSSCRRRPGSPGGWLCRVGRAELEEERVLARSRFRLEMALICGAAVWGAPSGGQICGVQRATGNRWPVEDGAAVADEVDDADGMRRRRPRLGGEESRVSARFVSCSAN
ncbi:hypothetical protein H0E87_020240 [Populus deltoides]|uniref:Uncharacterized protein n=1 Tax=Populus deltoides TaxID=3696 RepID=A0A8T2XM10_POPDE|nr:hypothetical protein H0E87_020240 [Populus deltoides]